MQALVNWITTLQHFIAYFTLLNYNTLNHTLDKWTSTFHCILYSAELQHFIISLVNWTTALHFIFQPTEFFKRETPKREDVKEEQDEETEEDISVKVTEKTDAEITEKTDVENVSVPSLPQNFLLKFITKPKLLARPDRLSSSLIFTHTSQKRRCHCLHPLIIGTVLHDAQRPLLTG